MNEVEYYVGIEGVAINLHSPQGLLDALDVLHTPAMDNIHNKDKSNFCTSVLSAAMDRLRDEFGIEVGEGQ